MADIKKVKIFQGFINGGASGIHSTTCSGECISIRGIVTNSLLQMSDESYIFPTLEIEIKEGKEKPKKHRLQGFGIPRIDVGEEIILHIDPEKSYLGPVVFQIIKNNKVIFTAFSPPQKFEHGSSRYSFE